MNKNDFSLSGGSDIAGLAGTVTALNEALQKTGEVAQKATAPAGALFGTLERSAGTALGGILRNTQGWQRSMIQLFAGLERELGKGPATLTARWLESLSTQTKATRLANEEKIASEQAAGTASLAIRASRAIATILNDAKQTFGGIFAFLSPVMGPAAAGPAAAGSASVAALASGITYAETGAWNIPDNTLAYLHAGEMVVPKSFASSLRENAPGQGAAAT